MGIFSSKYRFNLNKASWWVRVAVTSAGLSYKIKVDGLTLLDERRDQTSQEILKYFGWMGKFIQEDTRPFWKTITEALIIGGSVGAIYAILSNWLETIGYTSLGKLDVWPAIIIGMVIIFVWPAKLRFIK